MKQFYLLLLLFTFFNAQSQVQNYNLGDVVDDFTVTDIHGVEYNLYTLTAAGKHVVIDFSFTTCGPCQGVAPIFNELYDKYGCGNGELMCLTIFGTNDDTNAMVENFENTYGGSFNHAPSFSNDGGAIPVDNNFGIAAYPTTCIISPENKIVVMDIWPISSVASYEAMFPAGFNPTPMSCDSSAAVNDIVDTSLFSVYPNPFDGKQVDVKLYTTDSAIAVIYNILGKKVAEYQVTSDNQTLDTNLGLGTYLISIQTSNTTETRKLIVR